MGVPGLSKALKPYSTPTTVGCKTDGCTEHRPQYDGRRAVIIDGPSFAYCIYQRVIAQKPEWLTAIEAIPSYDELGMGAIAFLHELERYGLVIEKIYFDGCLPFSKRQIRTKRLQASLRELARYQDSKQFERSPKCKKTWNGDPPARSAVFEAGFPTTSNTFCGLPPASFIVPALLDVLVSSKYGVVTHVVPGEAETYCAQAARSHVATPIVLSNDTDLFLHNLGPKGGFAYLSTIELRPFIAEEALSPRSEACEITKFDVFQPSDIARRLGVDLQKVGFQFSIEPSQTLLQGIEAAKAQKAWQQADFIHFLDQYVEPSTMKTKLLTQEPITNPTHHPQFLDPRISELVCQLETLSNRPIEVYLLPLLEDPSRASAWSVSTSHRAFAYSICALNREGLPGGISECNRKGSNYIMQDISILPAAQLLEYGNELLIEFSRCAKVFSDVPNPLKWRIFAILEVYKWHLTACKTPPTAEMMTRALTGAASNRPQSWVDIHFEAQIQALLYSLRTIRQVLDYALTKHSTAAVAAIPLQELANCLENLPPLAILMPSPHELARKAAEVDVESVLQRLAEMLNETAGYAT